MAGIKNQPSAQPSDLNSPVPKTGADLFADAQESGPVVPQTSQNLFADAQENGGGQVAQIDQVDPSFTDQALSASGSVLDAAGRILDYPGGAVRAGLANVAGMAQDVVQGKNPLTEKPIVTYKDLNAVIRGKGPSFSEYMNRLGVPEGGSVGGISMRGAAGFAADIATDPLTAFAKVLKGDNYLRRLLEKPGRLAESLGEATYKSAIHAKEKDVAKQVGNILLKNGAPVGGAEKLAQKVDDLTGIMSNARQALYDRFTELGGKIDVTDSTFPAANKVIEGLKRNPTLGGLATELEGMLNQYKGQGFVPIDVMSEWKTQLYDSLPKSAWQGMKISSPAKAFKAALANDFKNAIVAGGNKVEKGLGESVDKINQQWGALLNAGPNMRKAANGSHSLGLKIDGAVAAATGPKGYVAKKAFDVAMSPAGRTAAGKALMLAGQDISQFNLANQATRQVIATGARAVRKEK